MYMCVCVCVCVYLCVWLSVPYLDIITIDYQKFIYVVLDVVRRPFNSINFQETA